MCVCVCVDSEVWAEKEANQFDQYVVAKRRLVVDVLKDSVVFLQLLKWLHSHMKYWLLIGCQVLIII